MTTTFNFSRFLKILSNEWRLTGKKVLLFWGVMIITAILHFAFLRHTEVMIPKSKTFGYSFFFMLILQGFYLRNYYREFSSKTKTQGLLLLPASRNEMFWAKFISGIILYAILFSVYIFIVLKWNGIHNEWIKELKTPFLDDWRYRNFDRYYQTITIDFVTFLLIFLEWLFSVSAYLFGIMTFKKSAAFKSIVFWFIIVMGSMLITHIIYVLFTGVWPFFAFPGYIIVSGEAECDMIQMYPELLYGIGIFICLALIFISRIKYNEKTI